MDYDALDRALRGGKCPRCKGWGVVAYEASDIVSCECNGGYEAPISMANRIKAADAIADLRARNDALCAALAKIAPIVVHDGRDYAEVFFSDGSTHSTQAMTMNPQDWLDIQAAYEAAIAANRETSDGL